MANDEKPKTIDQLLANSSVVIPRRHYGGKHIVETKASFLTVSGVKAVGEVKFTEAEKARIQAEAAKKLLGR